MHVDASRLDGRERAYETSAQRRLASREMAFQESSMLRCAFRYLTSKRM